MTEAIEKAIEAAARARCLRDGGEPDLLVYYEEGVAGKLKRDPVPWDYVGRTRAEGSVIEQWPTISYWRWKYEHGARLDLETALPHLLSLSDAPECRAGELLRELVEHFHIKSDPDLAARTQYSSLMLAHGHGEYRYWFCVSNNSMTEAALSHLKSILERATAPPPRSPVNPLIP